MKNNRLQIKIKKVKNLRTEENPELKEANILTERTYFMKLKLSLHIHYSISILVM